jgi:hypothetical protein
MKRRMPWTIHLDGLHTILSYSNVLANPTLLVRIMLKIIGLFDLTAFVIGRQTKSLNIWRRYSNANSESLTGIDFGSGLPNSLLNLFSLIREPGTEKLFWTWPGLPGDIAQFHLWDAFRFAGMISCRNLQGIHSQNSMDYDLKTPSTALTAKSPTMPNTQILTLRILACIDAIRRWSRDSQKDRMLTRNSCLYPLFIAGCQSGFLDDSRRAFIEEAFQEMIQNAGYVDIYYETPILILREIWAGKGTAESIAKKRGWEVGLFRH